MSLLAQVHDEERGETLWAIATAFLVLVAHGILETARDALFLTHLPASQLPWVYLALAVLALLATRPLARSASSRGDLWQLLLLQLGAAAGTLAMLVVTYERPAWALYALYIWGGLASTLILLRFWILLTDRFTISQAKRLFPLIAAGPLLGSLVGYAIAGVLCRFLPPVDLLGFSAALFLASAGGSVMLSRARHEAKGSPSSNDGEKPVGLRESVAVAVRHPYVRRVALLLLLASVTVTLGDFIFKSVVAREVDKAHLGSFLALSYFAFDLLALLLLFTAVVPFVRSRGVSEALALQPALLLGGGVLLTIAGGLVSVLCLRGVDGALRWSLHKTATELLYVPLSARLRSAVKAVADIVAHRGGQALASLLILTWLAVSPSERMMGPILIACTALWIYLAMSLRQPYLDLFRETLSQGAIETSLEFPDLDMASLETLIAALSSPDERKVLASLYLLEQTERSGLIPALILYHPSPAVVLRALEIFTAERRADVLPLTAHLFRHPDSAVRAATMRAAAALRRDVDELEKAAHSDSPAVAATALVALAGEGTASVDDVLARLEPYLASEDDEADEVRRFMALAMQDHPRPEFAPALERLATTGSIAARREAARAMGAAHDERHLPVLVSLLAERDLREPAREALLAFGDAGLAHLEQALADESLPRPVRLHLPRTISRFVGQRAADILLRRLGEEPSGAVRYKILRGLGRLVAQAPEIRIAEEQVDEVIDQQLRALYENLHRQVLLQRGAEEKPERRTPGYDLLVDLLVQKEALALERLFRALGLRYRGEDLEPIYEGLQSPEPATRASSRELLQGLLQPKLRTAIVGLTEEVPIAERLHAGREVYEAEDVDYETLLAQLVGETSIALCCVAGYHAAELGLAQLRQPMEKRDVDQRESLSGLRRRSFDLFGAEIPLLQGHQGEVR